MIIQARIGSKVDKEVGETQFGFRPGSGTREGIFFINIMAQKHIEINQDLYTCFIDYSKAFDRVHHDQLISCLERIGIDGKDIRIIANLYWHQKAAIRIDNELSPFTSIQRGVRQGCVLSPYLFNIYTEFIFRESNELEGTNVHGLNLNNLRYADDTALLATDQRDLQKIVSKVKEESSKAGLDMNVKKTKTMIISKQPKGKLLDIKVDNQSLEQVDKFKYLGTQISNDGKPDTEITNRISIAKSKFSSMSKLMISRRLSIPTKLKILKCYVFSIFMYGAESWTLSKVLESRIEAFEMWCLRRIGNISWKDKVSNKDVLTKLNTERQLLYDIQRRKLMYYGHIKRRNNILTTACEGKLSGKRPRGRPRNNWFGDVREWTKLSAYECTSMAADRHLWSVIASQPLEKR